MIFWNQYKVADKIKNGMFTQDEQWKYLLGFILLNGTFGFANTFVFALITSIIIWKLYRLNRSLDNKNFLERFIGIGFPVYFKLLILFLVILVPLAVLGYFFLLPISAIGTIVINRVIDVIVEIVFGVSAYFMMKHAFIASAQQVSTEFKREL